MKKQAWLAIHRQDKQRMILSEKEAFNLDKRIWILSTWTVTSGHEKPGINKETPLQVSSHFTAAGIKCRICKSYACATSTCIREKHIRFNKSRRN